MVRLAVLSIMLALSVGTALADQPVPPTKPVTPPATAEQFPLPKDAKAPSAAPGGGGRIQVYEIPRGRDAVITEMRELLKKAGWTITKDDPSPSGRAIRLEVKKTDKIYKVSFTGDATRTALILTLP